MREPVFRVCDLGHNQDCSIDVSEPCQECHSEVILYNRPMQQGHVMGQAHSPINLHKVDFT